jgi:hypothetical protein
VRLSADLDVPVDVAFVRRGRDQGATGWADIAGPEGRAKEWSPSAHAAVGLGEPEPSERTTQWRCHAQDCNGAALARIVPPMREWLMGLGRLEPPTSSLSGFCPAACSPRKRPATWATDAPLETAGDHWEPLGSDGMWTKRGPRLARRQGGPILPRSRTPPALRSSATWDRLWTGSAGRARQGRSRP